MVSVIKTFIDNSAHTSSPIIIENPTVFSYMFEEAHNVCGALKSIELKHKQNMS